MDEKKHKKTYVSKSTETSGEDNSSRRDFLKKSAYAAPSLILLGSLLRPTKADAANNFGTPPSGATFPQ